MSRYIDADAISAELRDMAKNDYYYRVGAAYSTIFEIIAEAIDKMPTADVLVNVVPVNVKGEWIEEPNCWYRCSNCGEHYPSISGYMDYNYCPNCGAKVDGK